MLYIYIYLWILIQFSVRVGFNFDFQVIEKWSYSDVQAGSNQVRYPIFCIGSGKYFGYGYYTKPYWKQRGQVDII